MLGTVLEKIIDKTRSPLGSEMYQLAQKIKGLEVTSADAVLADPWLACHTPADLDELRMATQYLFTPQPDYVPLPSAETALSLGSFSTSARAKLAVEEQFEAYLRFVNTRMGYWRVFWVGARLALETGLVVGDVITEVDGTCPARWQQRFGAFYSEMLLTVAGKGLISVRRTRVVRPVETERVVPDWERFRQNLFASFKQWPDNGTFNRQQLLTAFIR